MNRRPKFSFFCAAKDSIEFLWLYKMSSMLLFRKLSGIIGWMNPMDLFVSEFLSIFFFHLTRLTTPKNIWTKVETLFGVQDEIRVHQLKNELFSLSPSRL